MAHQEELAEKMYQDRAYFVLDDMGCGKSLTAIRAADKGRYRRGLVICPGIARAGWVEEFNIGQTIPRLVQALETPKTIPNSDVIVMSYNAARNIKVLKWILDQEWDFLIIDEAHSLKNPNAKQTRAIYGANCNGKFGIASKCKHVWLLSGTIMPNDPSELWSHCAALFPDIVKELTYSKWIDRYCTKAFKSERVVGPNTKNIKELTTLIKPHATRRTKEQVLKNLPPLTWAQTYVSPDKLPPRSDEIREVERVLEGALAKVEGDTSFTALEAIKSLDKMHIASYRKWTGIAKAPLVAEFVNYEIANSNEKIVVFAYHLEVIQYLSEHIKNSVALSGKTPMNVRQRYIDGFRGRLSDFNPRVLIANLDICATALTLTSSNNVIFCEVSWTPKDVQQAAARCHRNGQTKPVLARIFSLQGTVDARIEKVLTRKIKSIKSFDDDITD